MLFFLDNTTVQRKEDIVAVVVVVVVVVAAAAAERNQAVLFNAPYCCEMNLIENFFGTWKEYTMKRARNIENIMELKEAVGSAFMDISAGTCQQIIKHITNIILSEMLDGAGV